MSKISVIIPVYNVEKYIIKCVKSIVDQTLKDIEIIIVNDGTKDNSIKLIKENFNDKRIKIYDKKNSGVSSARNYGIKKATSKYLFFVDSDDYIDPNCLKEMYDITQNSKADLVLCDYYKLEENGNKEHISLIPHYNEKNKKCSVISMPGPVCKLINSDIFKKNDIQFPENICFEDNAIMPFICALCNNFSYIQKPFYYYLQRSGSALNKAKYDKKWEDIFDSLDILYNKFCESKLLKKYNDELEYIYIEYLLHAANLRFIDYKEGNSNITRVRNVIKNRFPNWRKNKYYKQENIKYKIMCNLFYYNQLFIIKMLRRF